MRGVSIKMKGMAPFRMSLSRRTALKLSGLALPALASVPARADNWPSRPVHIIVPFAPGGSGDISARLVGQYIQQKTGQAVVVDNKAGANGIVGVLSVKNSPPDGYTLMLGTTSTQAANVHMYKKPGYDPEKDFTVVAVIGLTGAFLVVPAESPHKSLADLISYAKANPGKLNYGYFNATSQVPGAVLAAKAGVDWQGVAYKEIGNAWADLYAGSIQFMFVDLTAARGQVVANKVRPLAITLPERSPLYKDVPALAEQFSGFVSTGFLVVAVSKAVPDDIKQKLNTLVNEATFSPEINKRLVDEFALQPQKFDLAQCAQQDREERAKWADYVKIAKIEPQ
jgi:tripartite-type tricarboxylate transporter receptor subunit TctC